MSGSVKITHTNTNQQWVTLEVYKPPTKQLVIDMLQEYSLVNHASQPVEESLANMRTLSHARLSTKIVDNQLDAWLRFSVSMC